MPWVTEEEIQAAKNMTAYEYLRTHQAQRLQKTRTRNEWQLTDHDSFMNCPANGIGNPEISVACPHCGS